VAASSYLLIDADSGKVLTEHNADTPLPPASLTKMMTSYIASMEILKGQLREEDEVLVSEKAWKMGGSQMFLEVGDRVRVEDLIRGIIIQSGNDACVAMAEHLAGSEEAFALAMTEKGREIGLTASTFMNATGLDAPGHLMSVRDLATLARRIITDFPDYYRYYGEREFVWRDIKQPNRNPLLQAGVEGVDGLKTGYTEQSGYGLVATAKRGERRLVAVMAGLGSVGERHQEGQKLLEHGFRDFQEYTLYGAGATVAEADVWFGARPKVALVPAEPVALTLSREARKGLVVKLRYDNPVPAPVAQGQAVGALEVTAAGQPTVTFPLTAGGPVERAGMLGRITHAVGYLMRGPS